MKTRTYSLDKAAVTYWLKSNLDYAYGKLMRPNETYISGEAPKSTYIVGGCLTGHWTYIGLCSLCRYLPFS